MWQDPTNVAKRKPRSLRGTPANTFSHIASLTIVGTFSLFCYWCSNSEAEWVLAARKRFSERIKPKESEAIRREMFADPQFASIIRQVNERKVTKDYAEYETSGDK